MSVCCTSVGKKNARNSMQEVVETIESETIDSETIESETIESETIKSETIE